MTDTCIMTVTPQMATEWLANKRYEHQRDVRRYQVEFLAEEMRRSTFKQDTPIEFCSVDGSEWLTDGQHRLSAIVLCQLPQRFVIIKRTVARQEDVALDYTRTDKNVVRSIAEDYKTLSLESELGLTSTQVNSLGVAVQVIAKDFNKAISKRTKTHPDDRLRLMREYNEAYGNYLEVIAGSRKELRHRLERGASLAVALVTFRYSSSVYGTKIDEFWRGVAMDDGLRANDPRKVANRHLIEYGMIGGYGVSLKATSPAFSSRYLATCFNAHILERKINYAKPDQKKAIFIIGSPWKG